MVKFEDHPPRTQAEVRGSSLYLSFAELSSEMKMKVHMRQTRRILEDTSQESNIVKKMGFMVKIEFDGLAI